MKFRLQMIAYAILIIILVLAFILVNVYRDLQTKQDGYCTQPQDCESLVHPECVGSWTCASSRCARRCETSNITDAGGSVSSGGLSGSTVECVEDNNCQPGICPDGYKYQKSSCHNNRCIDLQFFADPCLNHY